MYQFIFLKFINALLGIRDMNSCGSGSPDPYRTSGSGSGRPKKHANPELIPDPQHCAHTFFGQKTYRLLYFVKIFISAVKKIVL